MAEFTTATAYSTDSMGMHPTHTLPVKLRAIHDAGFTQVELSFPDLEAYAEQESNGQYTKLDKEGKGDLGKLCEAAKKARRMYHELGMEVLVVHPFSRFEGYPDEKKRQGLNRAQAWFTILKELGCTMLQVGASDDPASSSDFDVIARDLRDLSDLAAKQDPPIQLAYEMWAWSAHANTWEHIWEICKRVDRPNFGLCLDTFHICALEYASWTSPTRLLPNATQTLKDTLTKLSSTIPPSKIFYLQISDGSLNFGSPSVLVEYSKTEGIDPLFVWSNKWRPLPFMDDIVGSLETSPSLSEVFGQGKVQGGFGGYFPVVDVIKAVLKTGWRGPWSYEVFYKDSMGREGESIPKFWTVVGKQAHLKIVEELKRGL